MVERVKSATGPLMNYTFLSGSFQESEVTIAAASESTARRKAMCHLWGIIPDNICPHAPNYEGKGLILARVEPIIANPG
jgi:hypothetical protein